MNPFLKSFLKHFNFKSRENLIFSDNTVNSQYTIKNALVPFSPNKEKINNATMLNYNNSVLMSNHLGLNPNSLMANIVSLGVLAIIKSLTLTDSSLVVKLGVNYMIYPLVSNFSKKLFCVISNKVFSVFNPFNYFN